MCYIESLHGFLARLTGSAEDGEEIMQDVFVRLWENRANLNPAKNIKSYIFTIAKNAALFYLREKKQFLNLDYGFESMAGDYYVADERMIAKDTQLLINIAVCNMPENRRRVFKLHQEGYSYEEIADMLHITQDNARQHVARARADVKDILAIISFFIIP